MREWIKGQQHIGIPTADFQATLAFYRSLGFTVVMQTKNGADDVAFLQLHDLVIETYTGAAAGKTGAIDHVAFDVTDIDAVWDAVRAGGYKVLDSEIHFLPFFENGVKYFMIEGPNAERIEFNQKL